MRQFVSASDGAVRSSLFSPRTFVPCFESLAQTPTLRSVVSRNSQKELAVSLPSGCGQHKTPKKPPAAPTNPTQLALVITASPIDKGSRFVWRNDKFHGFLNICHEPATCRQILGPRSAWLQSRRLPAPRARRSRTLPTSRAKPVSRIKPRLWIEDGPQGLILPPYVSMRHWEQESWTSGLCMIAQLNSGSY